MPIAPELQQTDRIQAEVDGFQTMARLHSLPTGSPECLAALPLRLAQNAHLRGSFVELLRDLQRRDPDFSLPDALAILLLAIGGPDASPNRRRSLDESVDLTAGFLAAIGGWPGSDAEPITDLDNPPDHDPRFDLARIPDDIDPSLPRLHAAKDVDGSDTAPSDHPGAAQPVVAEANPEPAPGSETTSRNPDGSSRDHVSAPESMAGISLAEITRALARLERGTVDLRLHLDSIDQRLSRMEPLLESAPAHLVEAPAERVYSTVAAPERAQPVPAPAAADHFGPPRQDLVHRSDAAPLISPVPTATAAPPAAPSWGAGEAVPAPLPPSQVGSAAFEAAPATAAPPAADTAPSRTGPPATGERRLTPRKDRFAAAMELPGTRSELHFSPREENPPSPTASPASAPPSTLAEADPEVPMHATAAAVLGTGAEFPTATTECTSGLESPPAPAAAPEIAKIEDSAALAAFSEIAVPAEPQPKLLQQTRADLPPAYDVAAAPAAAETRSVFSTGSPALVERASSHLTAAPPAAEPVARMNFARAYEPPADPIPGALDGAWKARPSSLPSASLPSADTAATAVADPFELEEAPERASRGPLVVGLVAVLLVALAAFLLLRDRPIPFLQQQPPAQQATAAATPPADHFQAKRSGTPAAPDTSAVTSVTSANETSPAASSRGALRSAKDTPKERALKSRAVADPSAEEQILATPTFVPEAVMKARLLSAPRPLYPKIANLVGLEGGVIFEAIVAKDGTVDGLTVIAGQHLLRDAASNAVRQWRYQPFLVHGTPVQVRTIIHVNVMPHSTADTDAP